MKVRLLLLMVIVSQNSAFAETLKGGNTTFMVSGLYGEDRILTIERGNGVTEKLTLKNADLPNYGNFLMDISAMNAHLASGKALDVPEKFKDAKAFINFASEKRHKIDETITDPVAKTYIFNLRMAGASYLSDLEKCDTMSTIRQRRAQDGTAGR